jgi:hypothetical protein
VLDPLSILSWARITPADPGPPPRLSLPHLVAVDSGRRYVSDAEFVAAHWQTLTEPLGHGFPPPEENRIWYSVTPAPGLRLIALNSAAPFVEMPGQAYSEGAISPPQVRFLRAELTLAEQRDELVIVATHHPSDSLQFAYGTALTPGAFRRLLNEFPCVSLHIAGHWHRHAVFDRGGYIEIVAGSIIDPPQEGRIIEVWRSLEPNTPGTDEQAEDDAVLPENSALRYWTFSHLDDLPPPDPSHARLFDDPLLPMRQQATELAGFSEPRP